jgi:YVTN family beta-propeller protein
MILLSTDDRLGYLVCEGDHIGPGSVVVIDLTTQAVTASVPVGVFPDGIALVP